jgi:hypothetical protein
MIGGSLAICTPAYFSEFFYEHAEEARYDHEFRRRHSSFLQNFRTKADLLNIMFYPIYLFRRLVFAAILVFLFAFPRIQLGFIIVSSIAVLTICTFVGSISSTCCASDPSPASGAGDPPSSASSY